MQFSLSIYALLAVTISSTIAAPSPMDAVAQCQKTCSTGCVFEGHVAGGICSTDGGCNCLSQVGRRAPKTETECWDTCSTSCIMVGRVQGGTCSSDGTCTCISTF